MIDQIKCNYFDEKHELCKNFCGDENDTCCFLCDLKDTCGEFCAFYEAHLLEKEGT